MSSLVKDRVLKRILMVGTGGTIACKSSEDGLKPLLTSEELLRGMFRIQKSFVR